MGKRSPPTQSNEGIRARNVSARVMAVGTNARATLNALATDDQVHAAEQHLARLAEALAQRVRDDHQLQVLMQDVETLKALIKEPAPQEKATGVLGSLLAKLKMTNVIVKETASLAEPLIDLAKLLRIPLSLIGLG